MSYVKWCKVLAWRRYTRDGAQKLLEVAEGADAKEIARARANAYSNLLSLLSNFRRFAGSKHIFLNIFPIKVCSTVLKIHVLKPSSETCNSRY